MTNSFITAFDALAHPHFKAQGLADSATFAPQYGAAIQCNVYIDRDSVRFLSQGVELTKNQVVITVIKEGVTQPPKQGDIFVVGSESFTVAKRLSDDEGAWILICQA